MRARSTANIHRASPTSLAALACLAAFLQANGAWADGYSKTVQSGKRKQMHSYATWDRFDCTSKSGVVKVLKKPKYGRLSNETKMGIIRRSRTSANPPCKGHPVGTFRVYYTSNPGFRGHDMFELEITNWRGRQRIDTYSITVR